MEIHYPSWGPPSAILPPVLTVAESVSCSAPYHQITKNPQAQIHDDVLSINNISLSQLWFVFLKVVVLQMIQHQLIYVSTTTREDGKLHNWWEQQYAHKWIKPTYLNHVLTCHVCHHLAHICCCCGCGAVLKPRFLTINIKQYLSKCVALHHKRHQQKKSC